MNNQEIAKKVVDRMLEEIQKGGQLPWVKPWGTRAGVKVEDGYTEIKITPKYWSRSGKPYEGVNPLLLSMSGKQGEFITFNQCKAEGGKVKKGAKSSVIVFWTQFVKETDELDENGEKIKKVIPVLKTYNVFHISDCEGIKQKHEPKEQIIRIKNIKWIPAEGTGEENMIPAAESVISDYLNRESGLSLIRDCVSDRAFYSPSSDSVTVPHIQQFKDIPEYYSTLFHEFGHSTGHSSRLNRFTGKAACAAFGSEEYSREELVAEITAASILNVLGIESGNSFRNSAAYVKSWSENIKNDPMMFITAGTRAEKAINLILGVTA